MKDKQYLVGVAKALRSAHRYRNGRYEAEGSHYIRMSTELATQIADRLEKIAEVN